MLQQVQVDEKSENSDLNCWELLQAGRIQRLEEVTVKQSEAISAWRAKCDSFTSRIAEFAKNKDEFGLRYEGVRQVHGKLKTTLARLEKQKEEFEGSKAAYLQQRDTDLKGYAAMTAQMDELDRKFERFRTEDKEAMEYQKRYLEEATEELSNVKRQLEAERAAKATALGGAHDEAEKWKREAGRVQREYSGLLDAEHKKLAHAEAH
eukprot:comp19780_c0_seq1/m.23707 comp19780_c0_seq1/g.23707  ORF comp19780_c0_seq1/g.23707 comp19780_c0_seq1/m.23707 type:complete len:207 (-) comp19780_c0_seq1:70-690(-)